MQFGKEIGVACSSFAITNIDDMFVLVTFFAEATTSNVMTPLKITVGQFIGFTVIIVISMIGFGLALVVPSEPIGFLGLLPLLLGVWKAIDDLLIPTEDEEPENTNAASMKSIFKVASITLINGGDNIGTYIPLFSQAKGIEIAVYVVVFYILLGVWCLVAYLIMGQKRFLHLVQKYIHWVIPFLYIGLGIFIIVKSECYPWSVEQIDKSVAAQPGKLILGIVTAFLLLVCIIAMVWFKLRKRSAQPTSIDGDPAIENSSSSSTSIANSSSASLVDRASSSSSAQGPSSPHGKPVPRSTVDEHI